MLSNLDSIRQKYLYFFQKKGHYSIPSFGLIPENDSSTLFTSAGMQPLIPYLLGQPHPLGTRLTNSQKCFRSVDIEEVGDSRHITFFEMLGNWSLGDYFKTEQLKWIFEFLIEEIKLDVNRLYVTVFKGDERYQLKKDQETILLWQKIYRKYNVKATVVEDPENLGLDNGRIFLYGSQKNWWSRSGEPDLMPEGEIGGGDSEIFYDFGPELNLHQQSPWKNHLCHVNCDCGRFIEIGNSVLMEYQKRNNQFVFLPKKNIDFGGGLERILVATEGKSDIFETSIFRPLIQKLEQLTNLKYHELKQNQKIAFRIIADHLRSSTMLIGEGLQPANKEQGYILRRLIRRSISIAKSLGIENDFTSLLAGEVIKIYSNFLTELKIKKDFIFQIFNKEEKKFRHNLDKGLKTITQLNDIDGEKAFYLYESFGFPFELTQEIAAKKGLLINKNDFDKAFLKHKKQSQTLSAGKFKGGLADNKEMTIRYHTGAHLLHQALRTLFSHNIEQRGSNITVDRARFDFSFDRSFLAEEIQQIENLVNQWIKDDLKVEKTEVTKNQALKEGALGLFVDRYPQKVNVYTIYKKNSKDFISKEICMGPHVSSTSKIGLIKIIKQKSAGGGCRRLYMEIQK